MTDDLAPELERILNELDSCDERARELCAGLTPAQLSWKPSPKSWSIAENLIHLRITTETFSPAAGAAIQEARREELFSSGPFSPGLMDRFFIWYVKPPVRIRLPAPQPLRPRLDEALAGSALENFLESQDLMREQIRAAQGIDLIRARVTSPIASYIQMSLLALFRVHTGHELRHLWQASRVRQQLGAES